VPDQLKFTAGTMDGGEFSGESLAGKPAVLWFWAVVALVSPRRYARLASSR
jgi:hypothetical protein